MYTGADHLDTYIGKVNRSNSIEHGVYEIRPDFSHKVVSLTPFVLDLPSLLRQSKHKIILVFTFPHMRLCHLSISSI